MEADNARYSLLITDADRWLSAKQVARTLTNLPDARSWLGIPYNENGIAIREEWLYPRRANVNAYPEENARLFSGAVLIMMHGGEPSQREYHMVGQEERANGHLLASRYYAPGQAPAARNRMYTDVTTTVLDRISDHRQAHAPVGNFRVFIGACYQGLAAVRNWYANRPQLQDAQITAPFETNTPGAAITNDRVQEAIFPGA